MAPVALLSVSDKSGLVPLAEALHRTHGYQLLSSGGTAKVLEQAGLPVTRVSDHTGAPEILGGRVKTLHPRVHGGILAKRGDASHQADLEQQNIAPIDMVVVNLYPFRETIARPDVTWDQAIENIDIGGPAMVRAAAKNHADVAVLTSPDQYDRLLTAMAESGGSVPSALRRQLALEAFNHTASYDTAIGRWMAEQATAKGCPWLEAVPLRQTLRYGENPHQKARWFSHPKQGWGGAIQLQGKELSTNNLLDLEAALATVREFGYGADGSAPASQPAAVVVKHTNPCGVAVGASMPAALTRALDADRVSAFGGIIAMNDVVEATAARELTSLFLECVVAPGFTPEAREVLAAKANLRLLELAPQAIDVAGPDHVRSILGGLLVQDLDDQAITPTDWTVASQRPPTPQEKLDLEFAWRLVRHVRSNAIVVAKDGQSLGVGAGQMNRVGSARIALEAAGEKAQGAVLASDGFFPFDDTVRLAASQGITAVIHPGGSMRDGDSIKACDELGLAMQLTGRRHFLH
ncbi:bifunctional phosphoribosylaminoimidazolecarboxamide formyltransferase/IMP cyclohydrolase [Synechococcus sp. CC9605]|uniref:Bifunctional purine biosynthesis protein PurH n=1 Tax=Synechococcus sp. (strain CC9605) TaxID=110662 RepID=PUR9_SYNSC|nr:bifunctional phosphoribosylaminoimidazolecarboxamide formyltransferase/IMP cyclohydrolase [Synechococcus sp. CC9605]Q3AN13.1 RecName: Full=Bifunctional purine biosynthesis protein PurH; Includes: RecName: Full=Phosphoribosylaminoimidazolecarboxamide formyltransferase; AltName: Full=AICAR transformylase; Includes: RecName: Full=IMP cyclohydrolase; AltName: Full=ATIC; AltName: Full=IMP synthase; AltName: Full=Inosinicase [Synechococcus sp. CC9605]ABB34019.1 phosphoribosylaminoimidazolecarboxamid